MNYVEACRRYFIWAARDPGQTLIPNSGLSENIDGNWHLENVNGPLAVVYPDGSVQEAESSRGC